MNTEWLDSLEQVPPAEWNALVGDYPFLRHEFLFALEQHGCIGAATGWLPRYLLLRDPDDGAIAGALPSFVKLNSWGEFVFDFAWADAYARHGLRYYPKLVAAAPYTPARGPRLLVAPGRDPARTAARLVTAARTGAREHRWSSIHWLFPLPHELDWLQADDLLLRSDIQYHWRNGGYRGFDDFLEALSSRKRKKIRRERRRTAEQGITLSRHRGDELDARQWRLAHHFYASTFEKKWNVPVLTQAFFEQLGATMGEQLLVVFAHHGGREVAASILFRGGDTLYGRYWGCEHDYHSLHFEACYYQGIEYAIEQGLDRFEPGAQGEHKIARGFLPERTHSVHWIGQPDFRRAIADYLARERRLVDLRFEELRSWSPYRQAADEYDRCSP
ncbi:MAG: GNAT family N-acetyltransferase [Halofilum sp. (in: g-proteobacteria)]|nr:GNAT family N-acetyltransferase [Halofilum sp. (in: g-proteobacteria)]